MKIYNEIMKMNSYLKRFNKGLLLSNTGLIKGITNNLASYPYKAKSKKGRKNKYGKKYRKKNG